LSIHPLTSLGPVYLTVRDLSQSVEFYEDRLGLKQNSRSRDSVHLGVPGRDLVVLEENVDARPYPRTTGLYHFAIRVPTRLDLARSLQRIGDTQTVVQGFADHLVSEAIYLPDPDGIGVEIYRDRPRDQWRYENGRLKMGTDPLDIDGLLNELSNQPEVQTGLHTDTIMGHMHLYVSHLETAEIFYRDILGFDLISRYGPSASFLSAGGYHHHIGINTWAGVGISQPPANATGLRFFSVELPHDEAFQEVISRVGEKGVELVETERGFMLNDPSSNGILLTTSGNGG
jgi:catechol 2,3-dioxygenase